MAESVGSASMASLKAELARKQEQFKREQLDPALKNTRIQEVKSKRAAGWLKNQGVGLRAQRDKEALEDDSRSLERSEAILKAKAALYERLRKRPLSLEEQQKYLVDFEAMYLDRMYDMRDTEKSMADQDSFTTAQDEDNDSVLDDIWVDYVDAFGRSRRCTRKDLVELKKLDAKILGLSSEETRAPSTRGESSYSKGYTEGSGNSAWDREHSESATLYDANGHFGDNVQGQKRDLVSRDMQREMVRQRWEQETSTEQHRGPVHFETVRDGEVRTMGTGYFAFSSDEAERAKQKSALDQLRDETIKARERRDKMKRRRKDKLQERLAKIKQRKAKAAAHAVSHNSSGSGSEDVDVRGGQGSPSAALVRGDGGVQNAEDQSGPATLASTNVTDLVQEDLSSFLDSLYGGDDSSSEGDDKVDEP
eukprot:m.62604 g.62604  ORF g.62604 m.62604 type:complete len:422 (-) comp11917_c0_seq2:146-1411(-)